MVPGLAKLRCVYCHDDAQGLLERCAECGCVLHADCRRAIGPCPTIGCQGRSIQLPPPEVAPPQVVVVAPTRRWRERLAWLRPSGDSVLKLSVLSACLVGSFALLDAFGFTDFVTREARVRASVRSVRDAAKTYRLDHGRWPRTLGELRAKRRYLQSAPREWTIVWQGDTAYLGELQAGGRSIEVLGSLFQEPRPKATGPAATCGVPPRGAHVRAHELSK